MGSFHNCAGEYTLLKVNKNLRIPNFFRIFSARHISDKGIHDAHDLPIKIKKNSPVKIQKTGRNVKKCVDWLGKLGCLLGKGVDVCVQSLLCLCFSGRGCSTEASVGHDAWRGYHLQR